MSGISTGVVLPSAITVERIGLPRVHTWDDSMRANISFGVSKIVESFCV
jgi:hypothetical protein